MANWAPSVGQSRQKDRVRAKARSQRLRREATPTEQRLWKALRQLNREGARFRRQIALDAWVFDFGDLSARLLIEVDGGVHERLADVIARDADKTAWAAVNHFHLLRFRNDDVWGDLDAVLTAIRSTMSAPHPLPPPRKGEGDDGAPSPC